MPVEHEVFQAAIDRLDRADAAMNQALVSLERELRHDYEAKIAGAVTDLKAAFAAGIEGVNSDVKRVDDHLTWQDRALGGGVLTIILTSIMYVVLYKTHVI